MSVPMADHDWAFYLTEVNDRVASIFLDLSLRKSVPDSERPHLVCCAVELRVPREDGLSASGESEVLRELEDGLDQAVSRDATTVGSITTNGRRDFFYYCADPGAVEATIRHTLAHEHPEYRYECDISLDADWAFYCDVLFPSPEEMQVIQNERTVAALAEQGDLHDAPRPISHWVYFRTAADRQTFLAAAIDAGFKVEDEFETDDGDLGVELERVDRVDDIDDATLMLFRLANEHNGDYDGWESVVVLKDEGLTDALPS